MIIGDKDAFAFEVNECIPESSAIKDIFLWIGGYKIGNEYPHFETYVDQVTHFYQRLLNKNLTSSVFDPLDDEDIFYLLQDIVDGRKVVGELTDDSVYKTHLIANWDEALDWWNIFVFEKNNEFVFVWNTEDQRTINAFKVTKSVVINVLGEFLTSYK